MKQIILFSPLIFTLFFLACQYKVNCPEHYDTPSFSMLESTRQLFPYENGAITKAIFVDSLGNDKATGILYGFSRFE